jgi:hypothetical protein
VLRHCVNLFLQHLCMAQSGVSIMETLHNLMDLIIILFFLNENGRSSIKQLGYDLVQDGVVQVNWDVLNFVHLRVSYLRIIDCFHVL